MYFEKLPFIYYSLDNATVQIVKDITIRTKIAIFLRESIYIYEKYTVQDGEKAEHIAARLYNNPLLHWVIFVTNDIVDPYNDWPLSDYDLGKWVEENMNPDGIHHYENLFGDWVNPTNPEAYPITNLEFYRLENDEKRAIKLIKPELVQFFIDEFDRLVKE